MESSVVTPTVGSRIRAAREASGLTQQQLGDAVGVPDHKRVSQWETGYRTPRPDKIARIAEVCGTTPGWLMFGD